MTPSKMLRPGMNPRLQPPSSVPDNIYIYIIGIYVYKLYVIPRVLVDKCTGYFSRTSTCDKLLNVTINFKIIYTTFVHTKYIIINTLYSEVFSHYKCAVLSTNLFGVKIKCVRFLETTD
jgi:hypothetical protein